MGDTKLSSDEVPAKFADWLLTMGCPPEKVPTVDKISQMCRGTYYLVWRSLMEQVESKEIIKQKRLQVFADDVRRCKKKYLFTEQDTNVLIPPELTLWRQQTEARRKVLEAETRTAEARRDLNEIMDKVSSKMSQRNLARQRVQDLQRRGWLLQLLAEDLRSKKQSLIETQSIAEDMCKVQEHTDVQPKLDKYLSSLRRPQPAVASSTMIGNNSTSTGNGEADEEHLAQLMQCRGDVLWSELYARRAALVTSLSSKGEPTVDNNRPSFQTVLSHTAALQCTLALEALKCREMTRLAQQRLALAVDALNSQLSSESCELLVLRCERARTTARVCALRAALHDVRARSDPWSSARAEPAEPAAAMLLKQDKAIVSSVRALHDVRARSDRWSSARAEPAEPAAAMLLKQDKAIVSSVRALHDVRARSDRWSSARAEPAEPAAAMLLKQDKAIVSSVRALHDVRARSDRWSSARAEPAEPAAAMLLKQDKAIVSSVRALHDVRARSDRWSSARAEPAEPAAAMLLKQDKAIVSSVRALHDVRARSDRWSSARAEPAEPAAAMLLKQDKAIVSSVRALHDVRARSDRWSSARAEPAEPAAAMLLKQDKAIVSSVRALHDVRARSDRWSSARAEPAEPAAAMLLKQDKAIVSSVRALHDVRARSDRWSSARAEPAEPAAAMLLKQDKAIVSSVRALHDVRARSDRWSSARAEPAEPAAAMLLKQDKAIVSSVRALHDVRARSDRWSSARAEPAAAMLLKQDKAIEAKKDEIKSVVSSLAVTERKIQNVRECLAAIFSACRGDAPGAINSRGLQLELPAVSIWSLRQFYEQRRERRKMELSMEFDVSENSFDDLSDLSNARFIDELKIYLKKFSLEKNRKLVLDSGEKIWIFETLQCSVARLQSRWQAADLSCALLCPAESPPHVVLRLAAAARRRHRLRDKGRFETERCVARDINKHTDEEDQIINNVKKRLDENLRSLQKTSKTLDQGKENLSLWSDNKFKNHISHQRTVDGKPYSAYEAYYLESLSF